MTNRQKILLEGGNLKEFDSKNSNCLRLFFPEISHNKFFAFTIAEVLITLVVIGIIAAITIPAVVQHTHEKEYAAAMQKARASIGVAFRLLSINDEISKNITTANYTKNVLSRYLKIIKTCDNALDCDFPTKVKRPDGSVLTSIPTTMTAITTATGVTKEKYEDGQYSTYSTTNDITRNYNNAYFFITLDGFHVMFFYNPYCVYTSNEKPCFWTNSTASSEIQRQYSLDVACHWGVYDMNGTKGPNQIGKDMGFVGSFYNGGNTMAVSVLPSLSEEKATSSLTGSSDHWQRANDYCNSLDNGNYRLPDVNELSLMYLVRKFVTDSSNKCFWSGSELPGYTSNRRVNFSDGFRGWHDRTNSVNYASCIRKDR